MRRDVAYIHNRAEFMKLIERPRVPLEPEGEGIGRG
jgi:hypothetical protein